VDCSKDNPDCVLDEQTCTIGQLQQRSWDCEDQKQGAHTALCYQFQQTKGDVAMKKLIPLLLLGLCACSTSRTHLSGAELQAARVNESQRIARENSRVAWMTDVQEDDLFIHLYPNVTGSSQNLSDFVCQSHLDQTLFNEVLFQFGFQGDVQVQLPVPCKK